MLGWIATTGVTFGFHTARMLAASCLAQAHLSLYEKTWDACEIIAFGSQILEHTQIP